MFLNELKSPSLVDFVSSPQSFLVIILQGYVFGYLLYDN